MPNEPTFGTWLRGWLDENPEWNQKTLAGALKVSEAAMSDWVTDKAPPRDMRHITRLSEITETDAYYLMYIAYGLPMPAPSDPKLKSPALREADNILMQLEKLAPDLTEALIESGRALLRLARRRMKS